jgi:hypothetical protein
LDLFRGGVADSDPAAKKLHQKGSSLAALATSPVCWTVPARSPARAWREGLDEELVLSRQLWGQFKID